MGLDILNEQLIGPLNEEQKKLIGSARLDSQRLSKLIRELLELARLESGYYPFKHDRLNIAQLVESVLQPLQLPAEEKKVAIKTFVQEQLPIYDGDSQQLSWVITNLMNNALRSSSTGGEVTLEAFGKGPYLIFRVSDNGNGIPPDQLTSIFDKFVQIENNGVNSRGSVGLGLAIVKEIVNHYSGKIDVKSELGQGSMFTVSLPLPSFEPREEKNA
jgi:signal transduction histidine kinase